MRAVLVVRGRGPLVHHQLHGEPLHLHALRALVDAVGEVVVEVDPADLERVRHDVDRARLTGSVAVRADGWEAFGRSVDGGVLLHDVLCPLVTSDFLASVVARAGARPGSAFVAVRPVTDTLKTVVEDRIERTVDRDSLVVVTSPVVVPGPWLVAASSPPPYDDFAALVVWLRERGQVELVPAPSLGRRVEHARAVHLLECLDEVGHRVRSAGPGSSGPGR